METLNNCASAPATVNVTNCNKWSLVLKVGMGTEAAKKRKVDEGQGKSFVCLRWLKSECPGACSDVHRANKGTAEFLNRKFALNLTPKAISKKIGGK